MAEILKMAHLLFTSFFCVYFFFKFLSSCSAMASKKSSVWRYIPSFTFLSPWIHPAKSLVYLPDSTQSMQAFSRSEANFSSSGVSSNFARCSRPRVHANIDAIGLVDVGKPCWCCLKKEFKNFYLEIQKEGQLSKKIFSDSKIDLTVKKIWVKRA